MISNIYQYFQLIEEVKLFHVNCFHYQLSHYFTISKEYGLHINQEGKKLCDTA